MKRNTAQLKGNLIQAGIEQICQHGIDNLSLRTVLQKVVLHTVLPINTLAVKMVSQNCPITSF